VGKEGEEGRDVVGGIENVMNEVTKCMCAGRSSNARHPWQIIFHINYLLS
jgi:hypothetical protein